MECHKEYWEWARVRQIENYDRLMLNIIFKITFGCTKQEISK